MANICSLVRKATVCSCREPSASSHVTTAAGLLTCTHRGHSAGRLQLKHRGQRKLVLTRECMRTKIQCGLLSSLSLHVWKSLESAAGCCCQIQTGALLSWHQNTTDWDSPILRAQQLLKGVKVGGCPPCLTGAWATQCTHQRRRPNPSWTHTGLSMGCQAVSSLFVAGRCCTRDKGLGQLQGLVRCTARTFLPGIQWTAVCVYSWGLLCC